MTSLLRDLGHARRGLRKAPVFTAVAALTVGLGIGATTTLISVASAVLVRPAPGVRDAGRLVTLHSVAADGSSFHAFSTPDYRDYAAMTRGRTELAAYSTFPASLRTRADPVLRAGLVVSGNYFSVLGVEASLGRLFGPEDDRPGTQPVVVLSEAEWRSRFAGAPDIVGTSVSLNGSPVTVVGIAGGGFHGHVGLLDVAVWLPLAQQRIANERAEPDNRRAVWLEMLGRLSPGQEPAALASALSPLAARLGREAGADYDRALDVRRFSAVPAAVVGPATGFFALLLALGGLVLLIASINVASVLLARATSRRREIAVRLALGASPAQLRRLLATESLLLFLLGGGVGVLLALVATRGLAALPFPMPVPVVLDFHLDGTALAVTLAIALITGFGVGMVPARQATRTQLTRAMREEPASGRAGRLRLRGAMVVAQVAGSVVLLAAATLLARALSRAGSIELGFEPAGVHAAGVELRTTGWDGDARRRFGAELRTRAASLPGVTSAAHTDILPLVLSNQSTMVNGPGRATEPNVGLFFTDLTNVSAGYFETMKMAIVRGRAFTEADDRPGTGVVIVNETLARQIWGDDDPLGKALRFGSATAGRPVVVVGVASDGKYRSVGEDPLPMTYSPISQADSPGPTLIVRSDAPAGTVAPAIRELVRSIAPDLPLAANGPLSEMTNIALLPSRIAGWLAAAFGLVGLLLAAVGLYGVLAYGVSLRRRELGIRLALGAEAGSVRRLVLGSGLRLTALGLGIGLLVAAGLAQLLRNQLYGLSPFDPLSFAGVALVLGGVALLAADPAARRAARTEPLEALREM